MKKLIIFLLAFPFIWSCGKDKASINDSLNISGFKTGEKTEIINVKLKTGEKKSTAIDCYVFSSAVFDPNTSGLGYVDCNSYFNLVNPLSGELINRFLLPGHVSQTVIDIDGNALIGNYYDNDASYVVKVDMSNGDLIAKNVIDFSDGIFACVYFYKSTDKEYVLLKADSTMTFINAENGSISKTIKVESIPDNATYDASGNRLIGLTHAPLTEQNFIEILNIDTGELISKAEVKGINGYLACFSDFDKETNCYVMVTPQNDILFIDIQSGEIKDSYAIDFEIMEFVFWRSI